MHAAAAAPAERFRLHARRKMLYDVTCQGREPRLVIADTERAFYVMVLRADLILMPAVVRSAALR
jgi:hypothetical protein